MTMHFDVIFIVESYLRKKSYENSCRMLRIRVPIVSVAEAVSSNTYSRKQYVIQCIYYAEMQGH